EMWNLVADNLRRRPLATHRPVELRPLVVSFRNDIGVAGTEVEEALHRELVPAELLRAQEFVLVPLDAEAEVGMPVEEEGHRRRSRAGRTHDHHDGTILAPTRGGDRSCLRHSS